MKNFKILEFETGDSFVEIDGKVITKEEFAEKYYICKECGDAVNKEENDIDAFDGYCPDCWNDLFCTCDCCGETFSYDDVENDAGDVWVCKKCLSEKYEMCEECGYMFPKDDMSKHDGYFYCEDCFDDLFATCCECGEVCDRDDMYEYCGDYFCNECFFNEHEICYDCEDAILAENAYYDDNHAYCECCWYDNGHDEGRKNKHICSYHDMKDGCDISFYGIKEGESCECNTCGNASEENCYKCRHEVPHYGFELEVSSDSRDSRDTDVIDEFYYNFPKEYLHYEEDGSLDDDTGFEIISQPATLEYHLVYMKEKYQDMMQKLIDKGYNVNDSRCGLHFHIDDKFFSNTIKPYIAKICKIFIKFGKELNIFTKRKDYYYCAPLIFDEKELRYNGCHAEKYFGKNCVDMAKAKYIYHTLAHYDRYYAVNITNKNTIEIRLCRSTLNWEEFVAVFKLIDRIVRLSKETKVNELFKMTWEEILGDDSDILNYWNKVSKENNKEVH